MLYHQLLYLPRVISMKALSKSKIIAFRQCPKRLWLEVHQIKDKSDSSSTEASYSIGNQIGDIARTIYDPTNTGHLIEPFVDGFNAAFEQTQTLLTASEPIFEAGFCVDGALSFADVLLPTSNKSGQQSWRMVEVKSSTSVKNYHLDDIAIQSYVAKRAGVPLTAVALAHIDSSWIYRGDGDYQGLLVEADLTEIAFSREAEVQSWIADAHDTVQQKIEPQRKIGKHCVEPYECGFLAYCQSHEPQAEYPTHWLPGAQNKKLKAFLTENDVIDLRYIPDDLLNAKQQRVKTYSLSDETYFDAVGSANDLAPFKPPLYFLDFETINFAIPLWKDTRPFQQVPFQYSIHRLGRTGKLKHTDFLDLSGKDPSKALAEQLIIDCGESGAIFVYNAGFETARIKELAARFPRLETALLALNTRIVDLLPIAKNRYYHPSQHGSWSIKKVLPPIAPDLSYADKGVKDGGMAMIAFQEAISESTTDEQREIIRQHLLDYCELDTLAMVRLWAFFSGKPH